MGPGREFTDTIYLFGTYHIKIYLASNKQLTNHNREGSTYEILPYI